MKKAAFYLIAAVITTQLLIVSGVLYGCFRTGNGKCTGDKAGELMLYITTQSFALYAAEK